MQSASKDRRDAFNAHCYANEIPLASTHNVIARHCPLALRLPLLNKIHFANLHFINIYKEKRSHFVAPIA